MESIRKGTGNCGDGRVMASRSVFVVVARRYNRVPVSVSSGSLTTPPNTGVACDMCIHGTTLSTMRAVNLLGHVSSGPLGVPVHYHYYMAVAVEYWCTLVAV